MSRYLYFLTLNLKARVIMPSPEDNEAWAKIVEDLSDISVPYEEPVSFVVYGNGRIHTPSELITEVQEQGKNGKIDGVDTIRALGFCSTLMERKNPCRDIVDIQKRSEHLTHFHSRFRLVFPGGADAE